MKCMSSDIQILKYGHIHVSMVRKQFDSIFAEDIDNMYTISSTFYNNLYFCIYVTICNLYEVLRSRSPHIWKKKSYFCNLCQSCKNSMNKSNETDSWSSFTSQCKFYYNYANSSHNLKLEAHKIWNEIRCCVYFMFKQASEVPAVKSDRQIKRIEHVSNVTIREDGISLFLQDWWYCSVCKLVKSCL